MAAKRAARRRTKARAGRATRVADRLLLVVSAIGICGGSLMLTLWILHPDTLTFNVEAVVAFTAAVAWYKIFRSTTWPSTTPSGGSARPRR